MKKLFALSIIAIIVSGCALGPTKDAHEGDGYSQTKDNLTITFTKDGKWSKVVAVTSAPIIDDSPAGIEAAGNRARTAANRDITKFQGNNADVSATTRTTEDENGLHSSRKELVTETSKARLVGGMCATERSGDNMIATCEFSKQSILVAKDFRKAMN